MGERTVRFGLIGLGMMGKEFASAAARWIHLERDIPRPEIVGICSPVEAEWQWFEERVSSIKYKTKDYQELLTKEDIDVIYVATPHNLHEVMCIDALKAGKHLMCEKPFGIDYKAGNAIYDEAKKHPELVVRCASQMLFYPGAKMMLDWFKEGKYGRIIQMRAGYKHSSDLNPHKPINWKRQVQYNGAYGVMGDLGPHVLTLPLRAGVKPQKVTAHLDNIITQRPDGKGGIADCDTWDNALLLTESAYTGQDASFPFTMEIQRIAPGCPNEWFVEIYGSEGSIRYSTHDTNTIYSTVLDKTEQKWTRTDIGYQPYYQTITGPLAHFGFGDAILQMWAAFCDEINGKTPMEACMKPEEAVVCHSVFTSALASYEKSIIMNVK